MKLLKNKPLSKTLIKSGVRKKKSLGKIIKAKAPIPVIREEIVYVKKPIEYDPAKHGDVFGRKTLMTSKPGCASSISGMPTGCGLFVLYGISWFTQANKEYALELLEKVKEYIGDKTVMATMGDSYKAAQKVLLEIGFTKVADFMNSGHGPGYRQHLYVFRNHKYTPLTDSE